MQLTHQHARPPRRARRSQRGAALVEYALLVALIAVVCIVAVTFMGDSTSTTFTKASGQAQCPDGKPPVYVGKGYYENAPELEYGCK